MPNFSGSIWKTTIFGFEKTRTVQLSLKTVCLKMKNRVHPIQSIFPNSRFPLQARLLGTLIHFLGILPEVKKKVQTPPQSSQRGFDKGKNPWSPRPPLV